jgi:hypothetical protein
MNGNPLFDQLVAECGLSALFARSAMTRALKRTGAAPDTLTPKALAHALPEIKQTLAPYIEGELDAAMKRLAALSSRL